MNVTADVFNQECSKIRSTNEHIGPIQIVLIDPSPRKYLIKTFSAAVITLANMLIGGTTLIVLLYSITDQPSMNNLHVFICTAGFQLLIPSGILLHNNLNELSLKEPDINIQHAILQASGLAMAATGSFLVISKVGLSASVHSFTGMLACAAGICTCLIGSIAYFLRENSLGRLVKAIHAFVGILAFLLSSICFVTGILEEKFKSWLPFAGCASILVCLCGFYSLTVIYFPFMKHVIGNRYENNIEDEADN